jgi:hypothetical protein
MTPTVHGLVRLIAMHDSNHATDDDECRRLRRLALEAGQKAGDNGMLAAELYVSGYADTIRDAEEMMK